MHPVADDEAHRAVRVAEGGVVRQLTDQEQVLPSGDERDGRDGLHILREVHRLPPRVAVVAVLDPVAEELRVRVTRHAHRLRGGNRERPTTESAAGAQQRPGLRRQRPLLDVQRVGPCERGVDRESAARVEDRVVEASRGDRDAQGVGTLVAVAVGPLRHAEVASAPGVHTAGRPRLRAQPAHGRLPVGDLVVQRVERAARTERAAAALHHDMVPAFGEEERHPGDAVTPIGSADQHGVPAGPLCMPMVGEESDAVVRRDGDVG